MTAASVFTALLLAQPASADQTSIDPKTSVVVSRLPLIGGAGQVQVQAQIGTDEVIGFEIVIPAAGGSWTASADIAVPTLGIHCKGVPGADLHYLCGANTADWENGNFFLPTGSYQLALPVRRIGSIVGLTGITVVNKTDIYGEEFPSNSDTFPVVDGRTDPMSRAEVRNLDTRGNFFGDATGYGDIAVTTTIVPGETVLALDVGLPGPGVKWKLLQTLFAPQLSCSLATSSAQQSDIHCVHLDGGRVSPFPASRFTVVLRMSVFGRGTDGASSAGTAVLSFANGLSQAPDTFNWTSLFDY
ncbi:hypothetical protein ACSMXN_17770 [Jatrophihabitans sp. DSM 45814]